jgi:hypothetical protein
MSVSSLFSLTLHDIALILVLSFHAFPFTSHIYPHGWILLLVQGAATMWKEWVKADRRAYVGRLNVALLESTFEEHCLVAVPPLLPSSALVQVLGHALLSAQDARRVALQALKVSV